MAHARTRRHMVHLDRVHPLSPNSLREPRSSHIMRVQLINNLMRRRLYRLQRCLPQSRQPLLNISVIVRQ